MPSVRQCGTTHARVTLQFPIMPREAALAKLQAAPLTPKSSSPSRLTRAQPSHAAHSARPAIQIRPPIRLSLNHARQNIRLFRDDSPAKNKPFRAKHPFGPAKIFSANSEIPVDAESMIPILRHNRTVSCGSSFHVPFGVSLLDPQAGRRPSRVWRPCTKAEVFYQKTLTPWVLSTPAFPQDALPLN